MKLKMIKESSESINKLPVRRMNTFSQTPSLVLFMEVRKYFLFLIVQERLTTPTHARGVALDKCREPCPQGSEVLESMPWNLPMLKDPEKTPRGVPASILLMTVKLGGRYVFLNPRIHPVQWHAYTIRMPGAGVGSDCYETTGIFLDWWKCYP